MARQPVILLVDAQGLEAGVVGIARLTLSRREQVVVVEPQGWCCSHCAPQIRFGHSSSAAPGAILMPRWWPSLGRSLAADRNVRPEQIPRARQRGAVAGATLG